jgi:hypothetical protein
MAGFFGRAATMDSNGGVEVSGHCKHSPNRGLSASRDTRAPVHSLSLFQFTHQHISPDASICEIVVLPLRAR